MSANGSRIAAAGLVVGLAVLLVAGFAFGLFRLLSAPSDIGAPGRLFEVRKGESSSELALRLQSDGVIRSAAAFSLAARVEGKTGKLRSGTYRLEPGMGTLAVLNLVVEGKEALQKVLLPEGLTLRETGSLLERYGIVSSSDFLKAATDPALLGELGIDGNSAEGYLFPDTYFMPEGYGAIPALEDLVATFKEKVATIPEAAGMDAAALRGKVILASIIEKEYRIPEEAPLIASVFTNRLRIGMGLQSCATVVYVLTERLGKPHPEVVYDKDLKIKDPFNTYLYRGLPPAPISSPGLVALRAAFEPASTAWLYFRLVDPVAGTHHFSTTFDEHVRAGQLVLTRIAGQ